MSKSEDKGRGEFFRAFGRWRSIGKNVRWMLLCDKNKFTNYQCQQRDNLWAIQGFVANEDQQYTLNKLNIKLPHNL